MATITITFTAPDNAVPLVRRALGTSLGEAPPTTAAALKDALERECNRHIKSIVKQQKQTEAQLAAMADDSDGVASW